jgi:signal transduction histidine kinase
VFPFHIIVNQDFVITHLGEKVTKLVPGIATGMKVNDWFDITLPVTCKWNWPDLILRKDASFDLEMTAEKTADVPFRKGLRFTGGLYITEELESGLAEDTYIDMDDDDKSDDEGSVDLSGFEELDRSNIRGLKYAFSSFPTTSSSSRGAKQRQQQQQQSQSPVILRTATFLVQPDVESLAEMLQQQLTWSDIPKHSSQQRLIFLAEHLKSETYIGQKSRSEVALTQHMLEMKRMFVRYVSHEIRTPLNTVSMGLKLLQSLKNPTKSHHHHHASSSSVFDQNGAFDMVDEIKESCDIAIDILNDLLLYEKLEGGILSLDKRCETALATVYEVRTVYIFYSFSY